MARITVADLAVRVDALTTAVETIAAALTSAPIASAPAAPAAASEHFRPGKRDANGNVKGGFPCTLGCGRTLKTDKAAMSHDTKAASYHVAAK